MLSQDFPQDQYEVIVVDGESDDRTLEIIERVQERYPGRIRFLSNPGKTLPTGWNLGIQHSKGEYVIRVDGHSHIPKDFLSSTYRVAQRVPEASCVGGVVETKGTGFWGKVNAYVYSHPFGVGNSKFRTTKTDWEGYVDTVPYGAYKRELFSQVGYFNENLKRNEDLEMHARIRRSGGTFFLSTAIQSTYFVRNTLSTFLKKSLNDGKWSMIAGKRGGGVLRWRHCIPLVVAMMSIILGVASFFSQMAVLIFSILAAVYLFLLVGSSWKMGREHGWKYFVPCMLSFFLLHFSRGFGSAASFLSKHYWRGDRVCEEQRYDKNITNVAR